MLKIGVGPSSSHTLGPWRAAEQWIHQLKENKKFHLVDTIQVDLYGSLSLTGKGHATDLAIQLGLSGADPEYIPIKNIGGIIDAIKNKEQLFFNGEKNVPFYKSSIVFNREFLPFHANGITFRGFLKGEEISTQTYFSIGGGFIVQENDHLEEEIIINKKNFPFPINRAIQLEEYCEKENLSISEIVYLNELELNSAEFIDKEIHRIWDTMLECMYTGCHTEGRLPGGLNVKRRAFDTHKKLIKDTSYTNTNEWITAIRSTEVKFIVFENQCHFD
jgi:L-serine dehydratase